MAPNLRGAPAGRLSPSSTLGELEILSQLRTPELAQNLCALQPTPYLSLRDILKKYANPSSEKKALDFCLSPSAPFTRPKCPIYAPNVSHLRAKPCHRRENRQLRRETRHLRRENVNSVEKCVPGTGWGRPRDGLGTGLGRAWDRPVFFGP